MRLNFYAVLIVLATISPVHAGEYMNDYDYQCNQNSSNDSKRYIGNVNTDSYDPDSIFNPYGQYGSSYSPDSINNPYSEFGSPYSNKSATNPYATDAPKLYDEKGNYRGKMSANSYDPDSISNPYGQYGSPYSPDSINNHYGAGNPYSTDVIGAYGE